MDTRVDRISGADEDVFDARLVFFFAERVELLDRFIYGPIGDVFREIVNKRKEFVGRHNDHNAPRKLEKMTSMESVPVMPRILLYAVPATNISKLWPIMMPSTFMRMMAEKKPVTMRGGRIRMASKRK